MVLVDVLVILCVCGKQLIALQVLVVGAATIIHVGWVELVACVLVLAFSYLKTEGGMETQVLEAMYLVVDVSTTDERACCLLVVAAIKHCQRVLGSVLMLSESPLCVTQCRSGCRPLEVTAKVLQCLLHIVADKSDMIWRSESVRVLCRVHVDSCAYSISVSLLVL